MPHVAAFLRRLSDAVLPWSRRRAKPVTGGTRRLKRTGGPACEAVVNAHAAVIVQRQVQEHRERLLKIGLTFLGVLGFLGFYLVLITSWGSSSDDKPSGDLVAIVRVHGPIADGSLAGASKVVKAIRAAFEDEQVKRVVLHIDSPGGAPVEAERIIAGLQAARSLNPKPVTAWIGNVGASAAFMVAMHADEVISARYSLVGSIGAVMSAWDLSRTLAKVDARQKVFASGDLKNMLNPFTAENAAADGKAQQMVNVIGAQFVADLQRQRGGKLKKGVDVSTGEVWPGVQALEIGLIDKTMALESLLESAEFKRLKPYQYGPFEAKPLLQRLGLAAEMDHLMMRWLSARGTTGVQLN